MYDFFRIILKDNHRKLSDYIRPIHVDYDTKEYLILGFLRVKIYKNRSILFICRGIAISFYVTGSKQIEVFNCHTFRKKMTN